MNRNTKNEEEEIEPIDPADRAEVDALLARGDLDGFGDLINEDELDADDGTAFDSGDLDDENYDGEDEDDEDYEPLPAMDSEEKARFIAGIADALRAVDITLLDLRELTTITDFFLICTGNSSIQIRAIANRIEERLRERGERKLRVEGFREATWILLDYSDVVVHIMAAEQREFFNIEAFWGDAPRIELEFVPEPTTAAASRFDAPAA